MAPQILMQRSTINPAAQQLSESSNGQQGPNSSRVASSRLYMSRMGSYSNHARGGSRSFSGSKSMNFNYSRAQQVVSTLKQDLEKSRISPSEMFQSKDVIGGDDQTYLFSTLFSTSDAKRPLQTDVEFKKRARYADEEMPCEDATGSSDSTSALGKVGKKTHFDELMDCISNCGYEFDQEQKFNAGKYELLKARNKLVGRSIMPEDAMEVDE